MSIEQLVLRSFYPVTSPGRVSSGYSDFLHARSFARSSSFVMADLSEQRAAVKFCFLLGKNAAETVDMLNTAYKDDYYRKNSS